VRVGFVGAGAITQRHLGILAKRSEVEVAAVCDLDAQRAQVAADAVGATAHTGWQSMLDEEHLDALIVCTPPESHAAPALAALGRGVPVYVEKPLARTYADARAIVSAWEESETVCAVGYQWRSLDLLHDLRSALHGATPGMLISRSIGPTEKARGDLADAVSGSSESWFVDPRRSGGILFELGSHDIDLQLALAGPVDSVQAAAATGLLALAGTPPGGLDDSVAVILRFAGGGLGAIQVAWTEAQEPSVYALDVLAADIALHLDLDPIFRLSGRAGGVEVAADSATDPRESALAGFLDAVRSGEPGRVACSPADAVVTLRVALACERAIATGQRVSVLDADSH
jgi:myo-inositol 2-dehydrogenase / D-chiro-inositol 1-dehydrogenase